MNRRLKILCLCNCRYWFDYAWLELVAVYWLMMECFSDIHRRTELIPLSRVILKKKLWSLGVAISTTIEPWCMMESNLYHYQTTKIPQTYNT